MTFAIPREALTLDRRSRHYVPSMEVATRPAEERVCDFDDVVIPLTPDQQLDLVQDLATGRINKNKFRAQAEAVHDDFVARLDADGVEDAAEADADEEAVDADEAAVEVDAGEDPVDADRVGRPAVDRHHLMRDVERDVRAGERRQRCGDAGGHGLRPGGEPWHGGGERGGLQQMAARQGQVGILWRNGRRYRVRAAGPTGWP